MSGLAVVLCAPSGTGKTTVARELLERYEDLAFSVSVTTREARPGERAGLDYEFVDRARFDAMIEAGELLEWAEVHGQRYGTPRANLEEAARAGKDLILDIDVQGGRQVRSVRSDAVMIFLLPPSADALLERLRSRGSEDRAHRARRLQTALTELRAVEEFEYVLVNDRLDETVSTVRSIIVAERHRRWRRTPLVRARRDRLLEELERSEP